MMTNRMRFDQLEYKTAPIKKEAVLTLLRLSVTSQLRDYEIHRSIVEHEDNLLMAI